MESLKVIGVDCAHCAASVKGALEGVPGIDAIEIDLGSKSAIVSFNNASISKEQVKEKIEDVGFDVE